MAVEIAEPADSMLTALVILHALFPTAANFQGCGTADGEHTSSIHGEGRDLFHLSTEEVQELMYGLELGQYAAAFAAFPVTGADLAVADESDLLEAGLTHGLHRKRLLRQVREFSVGGVPCELFGRHQEGVPQQESDALKHRLMDTALTLLEKEPRDISTVWSKTRTTMEKVRAARSLDWSGRNLGDRDIVSFSEYLRTVDSRSNLTLLSLKDNEIGDVGIAALAESARMTDMFPHVANLYLHNNLIADAGVVELAAAAINGSFQEVSWLTLNSNQIGDAGVMALAGAFSSGAMQAMRTLYLGHNHIGDRGVTALMEAAAAGALSKLAALWLNSNQAIGASVGAITSALIGGAMPLLKVLVLDQPSPVQLSALKDACNSRGIKLHVEVR